MLRRYSSSPPCESVHCALCWQTSKQLHLHKFGTNIYGSAIHNLQQQPPTASGFSWTYTTSVISDELRDVIFVAIDFENLGVIKQDSAQNLNSQVGIAILDTRILAFSQPEKTILTYSFATGSPRYCTATMKNFLFGKTTMIH
jgi:hypothetical protein